MKKIFFLALAYIISVLSAQGQEIRPNFPNGFHLGLNLQGNLSQRADIIPFGNITDPSLKASPKIGYDFGIEASYHFAKYFGVSVGVDLASDRAVNVQRKSVNGNESVPVFQICNRAVELPIRFEFHYPIMKSNFSFYGALGVSFNNLFRRGDSTPGLTINEESENFHLWIIDRKFEKMNASMQMRLGVYYRLPYNDLLRMSITSNYTFRDRLQGKYSYNGEEGALTYRHNYMGLELSYIHCFRTKEQKAARGR